MSLSQWFSLNCLALDPYKSDAILLGTRQRNNSLSNISRINVAGSIVPLSETVKLLGVTLDKSLPFHIHVNQSTRPSFDAIATDLFDGDLSRMANNINVSSDLKPLDANLIPEACEAGPDEYIIGPFEVESKLSPIDSHKSSGPDELPTERVFCVPG